MTGDPRPGGSQGGLPIRFQAPGAYVQGPGVLRTLDDAVRTLSEGVAYVLGGATALDRTESALTAGLPAAGIDVAAVAAGVDSCTEDAIEAHAERARNHDADFVVGVGGGVALDVAKAAGADADSAVVTVPTVASTDAPCSSVSIVYDPAGRFERARFLDRNPVLVLVDTDVIAAAPPRFLRHGIGDAVATKFEAAAVARANGRTDAGGAPSPSARVLAESTYDSLRADGAEAVAAVARNDAAPAVESVVETVILRSGLGFESAGVAAAHAFHNAATAVGVREPHGLLVAFGLVAQLALEGRETAISEVLDLYADVGVRVTLADLGIDDVARVARLTADRPLVANVPVAVTAGRVADALRRADAAMRGLDDAG